jgi:hypothetical protein
MNQMEQRELPRYAVRGVVACQWAYWCSLACAVLSVRYVPLGTIRTAVMLVPALTAALCVAVSYWLYEACDEYVRGQILKGIVWTAIIVAAATLGYFVLELTGLPKVSMLWVNLLGWSVFNLQMLFVILRSR